LVTIDDLAASANDEFYKKLLSVWRTYDDILTRANAVDFDDLLVKSVKLLSLPSMREKIAGRYSQILVDEYQDTNKAQFVLTKLLVTNPNGLMVVGDAAQAIYSFRGADFRNLTLLSAEFPNLTTVRLPRNYRSTQTILDAAYGVIANNANHPILKLEADKEMGEKIEMIEAIDEREEAAYVMKTAERLVSCGETLGVLYRTNAQSRAIEEALIRGRIDYKLVGGIRFYNRAEIKDLLAYLRVIYNMPDTISWERIEKLGKRNRAKFEEWLSQNNESLVGKSPREVLEEIIEETGYMGRFDDRDEEDVARVENIKELLAVSSEFGKINEFLESVALIQSEELADKKAGSARVTMMTIHAAKGLEFDEVVIVGLEEGLLPHSRSLLQLEDVEEERRLMYVAMTRARTKLHLTLTRSRLMYGGRQVSSPSRFLSEIPQELLRLAQKRYEERELGRNVQRNKDVDYDARRIIVEEETKADFDEIDSW
jgi:DNA helicase-2/ATP-dependent DNA helicase PcrA